MVSDENMELVRGLLKIQTDLTNPIIDYYSFLVHYTDGYLNAKNFNGDRKKIYSDVDEKLQFYFSASGFNFKEVSDKLEILKKVAKNYLDEMILE